MKKKELLQTIFSVKNENKHKVIKLLGLKLKLHRNNFMSHDDAQENFSNFTYKIENLGRKIDAVNEVANTIFRYMSGIQLNKNYIKEREIIFESKDAPKDHINRYEFAQKQITKDDTVLDIACTCGYGSAMLAENAKKL